MPRPSPGRDRAPCAPAPRGALAAFALVLAHAPLHAADVVVRIDGIAEPHGWIGCSLFRTADGFPMETGAARVQWLKADAGRVACRFAGVPAGRHAVSVVHDVNGNRRADTNLVGMPVEQWGVSNNARPTLRAPRFDEAAFAVAEAGGEVVLDVRVAK